MSSHPQFTLGEWRSRTLPVEELTPSERQFARRLDDEASRRLTVEELRDGVRVETYAHVGVVEFEQFTVCIEPKLVGGRRLLPRMIDYAAGIDDLVRYPDKWESLTDGSNLLEVLALVYVQRCEEILRRGLVADYVEFEETLPAVRGRILPRRQVTRQFGRVDKIECRYDERVRDVWENRLLAAGLGVCRHLLADGPVRHRIRRAHRTFTDCCSRRALDVERIRDRRVYHRMNEHYRDAHELALILIDGAGIDDIHRTGSTAVESFLLNMNDLFEHFLERLYRDRFSEHNLQVQSQYRQTAAVYDRQTGDSYKEIRPDLLLQNPLTGHRLPVDAKYKRYDDKPVSSGDIYQLSAYAQALSRPDGPHPSAALLYPSRKPRRQQLGLRAMDGHAVAHIDIYGIPLRDTLEAISGERPANSLKLDEFLPVPDSHISADRE